MHFDDAEVSLPLPGPLARAGSLVGVGAFYREGGSYVAFLFSQE
jgi:hypothetical protein